MIITKQQAKMLVDLTGQIEDKYGIVLGYSNPTVPNQPPQKDADFMILEDPNISELHCFHKDDMETRNMGPYLIRVTPEPEEAKHDEKVEELLDRLNNDLLIGKIWFEPILSKEVDGKMVNVSKKRFPGSSIDVFETNIKTKAPDGNGDIKVYNYFFIAAASLRDKRFAAIKEMIDESWPSAKAEIKNLEKDLVNSLDALIKQLDEKGPKPSVFVGVAPPEPKSKPKPLSKFFSTLLEMFGF